MDTVNIVELAVTPGLQMDNPAGTDRCYNCRRKRITVCGTCFKRKIIFEHHQPQLYYKKTANRALGTPQ